jgi:hypothetical protein
MILDRPGTTLVLGEDLDNTSSGTGANGVGKASSVDALVKTPTGWIRMGDIAVGQELQMPDGSSAPVLGVYPQGKMPLFKVTFVDGRSTKVTSDHVWTVFSHRWGKSGTRGKKDVTTAELTSILEECDQRNNKPWYSIFVPTVVHPSIPDADLPIHPYLLGCLLGDGGISGCDVKFTSKDSEIIEHCSTLLKHHNQQLKQINDGYDWCVVNDASHTGSHLSHSVRRELSRLSLMGLKSHEKFIPKCYMENVSKQQKIDLLAGLLDTDGTVGQTKNVSFCSVSEQLAKDVQYLIRSLGGKATITTRTPFYKDAAGNTVMGRVAFNVSIRYPAPRELFKLPRKRDVLSQNNTQYSNEGVRVVSVERVEDGEAQCILVGHPDHLYITDEFVVTHNTTLLNALTYAIYDKPVSNISKDNLVNNINKKNMLVVVEFEKGSDHYRIERARKMKAGAAGNYVHLFHNGKDITPDSVSNTNTLIESIIGIPYELFVRIVAFSATHIPFLDLPVRSHYAANQTDIIEELFDLKSLSEKADILKDKIKETETSLDLHLVRVEQLEKEHERHQKQIESAGRRVDAWAEQNNKDVSTIQSKIKKIEDVDVELQRELHDNLTSIGNELREKLDVQRSLERKIKEHTKIISTKNKELLHLRDAKCPYCLQQYEDASVKIGQTEKDVEVVQKNVASFERELELIDAEVECLATRHKSVQSQITVGNLDELLEIKNKIDQYQNKLSDLMSAENPFIEPLKELEDVEIDPVDKTKINELKTLIDHQKFLLKLLTKKDSFVRKALLNKNIPFLNQRLAHYLTELGLQHAVEFTHEMTASISQFGRPMDFGNLSNGQRARVNLALSFAFRDVLQSLHEHINVCMLDEVLDVGLDTVGVQSAARMLKKKARDEQISMYIVSHRDEIGSAFDHKMIVQMSKGFSYINFDED